MSDYKAPPKNEMDHPRLALRGKKHENGKTVPNLKASLLANLIRLRCYTGIEGEKTISVKLDPREIEAIVGIIKTRVIPNREDHKIKLEKMSLWIGGKKRDQPGVEATILLGRHNGQVFISIFGFNSPKIPFPFTYGDTMRITGENNEPLDRIDESNICALAWCNSIMGIAYPATVKQYKHPESNFNNNGGGGYGGNKGGYGGNNGGGNNSWGNNNGGGGNSSNDSFDDDLAF